MSVRTSARIPRLTAPDARPGGAGDGSDAAHDAPASQDSQDAVAGDTASRGTGGRDGAASDSSRDTAGRGALRDGAAGDSSRDTAGRGALRDGAAGDSSATGAGGLVDRAASDRVASRARAGRPLRWRRAAAIAGAALIAVAATVVVVVSRGDSGDPASGTGSTAGSSATDPARDLAARANELAEKGERDAAIELLHRARRQYPDNALLAYTAGRICFSKYYWTEGLRHFRDAIRNDPAYRSDPELIKTVLRGFITTPSYNDDLAGFLRDEIGGAVQPLLEETARDHPNPIIRSRAAAELRRYQ
jgi:hypothetical protein